MAEVFTNLTDIRVDTIGSQFIANEDFAAFFTPSQDYLRVLANDPNSIRIVHLPSSSIALNLASGRVAHNSLLATLGVRIQDLPINREIGYIPYPVNEGVMNMQSFRPDNSCVVYYRDGTKAMLSFGWRINMPMVKMPQGTKLNLREAKAVPYLWIIGIDDNGYLKQGVNYNNLLPNKGEVVVEVGSPILKIDKDLVVATRDWLTRQLSGKLRVLGIETTQFIGVKDSRGKFLKLSYDENFVDWRDLAGKSIVFKRIMEIMGLNDGVTMLEYDIENTVLMAGTLLRIAEKFELPK